MWRLCVLLLWALLCPGRGNVQSVQEEIFIRTGSDLLLPIRRHLTLNHTDKKRCDWFYWYYQKSPGPINTELAEHWDCELSEYRYFPNTRISENGSLIISNVTLENDGTYIVDIYNSTGHGILRVDYTIHVEVPVSIPVLGVSCLQDGSAEISCRMEVGTKPNICLSVIGGSQGNYSASANTITIIVGSPGPWDIACCAENMVSHSEDCRAKISCPESQPSWGHLLSHGAVFVFYSGLFICIVIDLRKMKNEKSRSERRTRRRDQMEMEMEPTYYKE